MFLSTEVNITLCVIENVYTLHSTYKAFFIQKFVKKNLKLLNTNLNKISIGSLIILSLFFFIVKMNDLNKSS